MAEETTIRVKIGADTSSLEGSLNKASQKVQKFGDGLASIGTKLSLFVSAPLVAAGGKAIQMAADVEESENLFNIALGSMADQARNFSEELARATGRSQFEIRENIATIDLMLKSMGLTEKQALDMAQSMSQLTLDLSSFRNLKPEEAFNKLQAGITGETEPLKRIGILVDENTVKQVAYATGIAEVGTQLTQQQKVLARYQAIIAQTSKDQGDAARTAGSVQNQFRAIEAQTKDLFVAIGQQLEPATRLLQKSLLTVIQRAQGLVQIFAKLSPSTKGLVILFIGFVTVLGPLLIVIGRIVKALGGFTKIASAIFSPTVLVIGGFVALILILNKVGVSFETMKNFVASILRALVELTFFAVDQILGAFTFIPGIGKKFEQLRDSAVTTFGSISAKFDEFVTKTSSSESSLSSILDKVKAKIDGVSMSIGGGGGDLGGGITGPEGEGGEATGGLLANLSLLEKTSDSIAESISNNFGSMISGITSDFIQGTGNWVSSLNSFLIKSLDQVFQWAVANMGIVQALSTAFKAALSNPFTAAILIGALIAVAAGLRASFKKSVGMADGGLVTGPTQALIGEAGPELVIPLDRLGEFTNTSAQGMQQTIIVQLDGRQIARATAENLPSVLRLQGADIF